MTPAEIKEAQETMLRVAAEVFDGLKAQLFKKFPDADLRFAGMSYTGRVELHVFCKAEHLVAVNAECVLMEETISYPEVKIVVKEGG